MRNFTLWLCIPHKKYYLLFLLSLLICNYGLAQGYIDCATILADDDDYRVSHTDAQIKNGYTYMVFNTSINDYGGGQSLPIINGEGYHGVAGGDEDIYLAIFDPYCNQTLGTYIGGTDEDDRVNMDIDADGNIVISFETHSPDFQTTDGTSWDPANSFRSDVAIVKYTPAGTLIFSTVYGGGQDDDLWPNVITDGTDIYVYGYTEADDFPTTDGTMVNGTDDGFVLKYDGSGNLIYATVLGGSGSEKFEEAVVINGCLYVAGDLSTGTNDFVGTDGSTVNAGLSDVLFAKYDPTGNLVFSKVIGGDDPEYPNGSLLTDGTHVYIVGFSRSSDFPTTDGSTNSNPGTNDYFVQKYDLNGNLFFSRLYGGSGIDQMYQNAELVNGEIYIVGESRSTDFVTTTGVTNSGGYDVVLIRLDSAGDILASTFWGG